MPKTRRFKRLRTRIFVIFVAVLSVGCLIDAVAFNWLVTSYFLETENSQTKYVGRLVGKLLAEKRRMLDDYLSVARSNSELAQALLLSDYTRYRGEVERLAGEILAQSKLDFVHVHSLKDITQIKREAWFGQRKISGEYKALILSMVEKENHSGIIEIDGGRIALVAVGQLRLYEELVGTIAIGIVIDDRFATEIYGLTGSDIGFTFRDGLIASSNRLVADLLHDVGVNLTANVSNDIWKHGRVVRGAFVGPGGDEIGSFWVFADHTLLYRKIVLLRWLLFGFILISITVSLLSAQVAIRRYVALPFENLVNSIRHLTGKVKTDNVDPADVLIPAAQGTEIGFLTEMFNELLSKNREYHERSAVNERLASIGVLATQVAHDIRSPLTALKMVTGQLAEVPEERRVMIRNAVQRIEDIANDLVRRKGLDPAKPAPTGHLAGSDPAKHSAGAHGTSAQLLSSLIEPVVSEKRAQYRTRLGVEIRSDLDAASYGIFAKIQPVEFKRVLSNLINNAVEALGSEGEVTVSLTQGDTVNVVVADTGKGIDPGILPKLMQQGATFGKESGSGLGLYHGRTMVEAWGGALDLKSTVGKGTTVTITLPRAEPPSWFVPELKLTPNTTIVVIDDDSTIHQVWDGRFDPLDLESHNIRVEHFTSGTDVCKWHEVHSGTNAVYLCDYEFLGEPGNGLDLIEKLHIEKQSILVTSRYEEPEIQQRCAKLGIQLIPKGLAGYVPISVARTAVVGRQSLVVSKLQSSAGEKKNVLIVNDDEALLLSYKLVLKSPDVQILTASSVSSALKQITEQRVDVIFSDVNLGDDQPNGYELLKTVRERDKETPFYMLSGYSADEEGEKASDLGANGYLQLPVEATRLRELFGEREGIC